MLLKHKRSLRYSWYFNVFRITLYLIKKLKLANNRAHELTLRHTQFDVYFYITCGMLFARLVPYIDKNIQPVYVQPVIHICTHEITSV